MAESGQIVLESASQEEEEDHFERVAHLHTLSHYNEVKAVWRDLPSILLLVKPVLQLIVNDITTISLSEDTVGSRGAHNGATCVQVTLPIFLHDTVHDMTLHDLKRIEVLQVIQRSLVH